MAVELPTAAEVRHARSDHCEMDRHKHRGCTAALSAAARAPPAETWLRPPNMAGVARRDGERAGGRRARGQWPLGDGAVVARPAGSPRDQGWPIVVVVAS
eukprot:6908872-Prymnesium_polylepis.1